MRKHRISRPLVLLGFSFGLGIFPSLATVQAAPPNVKEIMGKVIEARKVEGSEAQAKLRIVSETGQVREREMSMATKLYDKGTTEKRLVKFTAPAEVQGTAFLVYDYDNKGDDMWIYMPALRKTRRLVSSDRSSSFMGSEFSYGDLNIPSLEDFNYEVKKDTEPCGDETCYVIEATPKSEEIAKAEGYSKKTYHVGTKTYVARKGLFYDASGKLLKEFVASDVKLLDPKKNRFRAMKMEITNKQNGRKSSFETVKFSLAPDTKDEFFTTGYLEK